MKGPFLPFALLGVMALAAAIAAGVVAASFGMRFGAPVAGAIILPLFLTEALAVRQLRLSLVWGLATTLGLTLLQYQSAFVGATVFSMHLLGGDANTMPAWLDNGIMLALQILLITTWNVVCHYFVWRFRPLKAQQ